MILNYIEKNFIFFFYLIRKSHKWNVETHEVHITTHRSSLRRRTSRKEKKKNMKNDRIDWQWTLPIANCNMAPPWTDTIRINKLLNYNQLRYSSPSSRLFLKYLEAFHYVNFSSSFFFFFLFPCGTVHITCVSYAHIKKKC